MTRTRLAFFFAISALGTASCGGRSDDMFSHSSGGIASGGSASSSSSTPAAEAGASGSAGETSLESGGAPSASGGSASGGASPVGSAGGPDAAGAPDLPPMPPACVPAPELCNGLDEDCDGVVDEGCPTLAPGNPVQRRSLGDSFGGTDFAETCANNEVLVGLKMGVGAWIDQITGVCQAYSLLSNSQSVPTQYSFTLGAKRDLTAHPPATTSEIHELTCGAGTVMVGVHISQQHTAFDQDTDQVVVPQLWLDCAAPIVNMTDAPPQLAWQNIEHVGPVTGSFAAPDAWFESDTLDTTQVLVGFHGAAGAWVDRVGLTASSLSVALHSQ